MKELISLGLVVALMVGMYFLAKKGTGAPKATGGNNGGGDNPTPKQTAQTTVPNNSKVKAAAKGVKKAK